MNGAYRNSRELPQANELVSLHEINERNIGFLLFDGLICFGRYRRYVIKVPFDVLSIGRYETLEFSTVGSDIWIQSFKAKQYDIWYRLGQPSPEYRRYHKPFLWMADFAKHVVDYLHSHPMVYLNNFRGKFLEWLDSTHPRDGYITPWLQEFGRTDFRGAIVTHANFLYCQAAQVDIVHTKQPVWAEVDSRALNAVPEQVEAGLTSDMVARIETREQSYKQRKTTVTPYVKRCFAHMAWARFLHSSIIGPTSAAAKKNDPIFPGESTFKDQVTESGRSECQVSKTRSLYRPIQIGDVVAIERDEGSEWKTEDDEYYAYVQGVTISTLGRSLSLLWFYRPGDTTCKKMLYPFEKELFLSDHCNCGDAAVYEHDVLRLRQVAFFVGPESTSYDFFCRQQYVERDTAWRTLQTSHFRCQCENLEKAEFIIGDTVLVRQGSKSRRQRLEPAILAEHVLLGTGKYVKVRRLLRKCRDFGWSKAAPNELVFTNHFDVLPISDIERRCKIGYFTDCEKEENKIPHPYNKNGLGDFFYITSRECPEALKSYQEKADRRLRGLDIFCGGGSFGRGLEENDAVEFEWAVDYCNEAIHTYKANLREGKMTKLFRGSVNHYLSQAMAHKGIDLVAQKGEVDMIISGNPCQGFSIANPHRGVHDRGLVNESLVASAISFIDFYRPKYALLENVLGIASDNGKNNVLAHVLCALVGMGYQVKVFVLDAWNFSSPQSRSRVFISCAAAGLEPLEEPPHTHSHPEHVIGSSLGKTANGIPISARYETPTPFEYVTAEEALKDLPPTDGRTSCVPFPDHRMSIHLSNLDRIRLESVPRHPPGMSFTKAVLRGYMPEPQINNFGWHNSIRANKRSRCWQRIQKGSLMPTVTTAPRPSDGAAGNCVHWEEHRLLTVMEVRRAQGFPDEEVVIGEKSAQYKIVGNSVARPVAFALGMSLRRAWLASSKSAMSPALDLSKKPLCLRTEGSEHSDRHVDKEVEDNGKDTDQQAKGEWLDRQGSRQRDDGLHIAESRMLKSTSNHYDTAQNTKRRYEPFVSFQARNKTTPRFRTLASNPSRIHVAVTSPRLPGRSGYAGAC